MAAYANATAAIETARGEGQLLSLPMAVSTTIYKGSLVTIDTDGYAVPAAFGTAGLPFAGVAAETITTGSADHTEILVWTEGDFEFTTADAAQTNLGAQAWLDSSDTGTPQLVAMADPETTYVLIVGRVSRYISATKVRVRISGYAMRQDTTATTAE